MPGHPVGDHLVPAHLPGALAGVHPRVVLHHPAAVQRLHQGAGPDRGVAAQVDPAAQDLCREHDRHEAGVRMNGARTTRRLEY